MVNSFSRTLSPGGDFPSPAQLLSVLARAGTDIPQALLSTLQFRIANSEFLLRSSGKSALYSACKYLAEHEAQRLVLVPAYTCPDVAAAVVRAGLQIVPVDVKIDTLEADADSLDASLSGDIVVLCNLYGLRDSTALWKQRGLIVIDDAAQATLSAENGLTVGARPDSDFGVLSFGRGKALSASGGGALIVQKQSPRAVAMQELMNKGERADDVKASLARNTSAISKLLLMWLFQHPRLYSIPAGMQFLKLGETVYEPLFEDGIPSAAQMLGALAALRSRETTRGLFLLNSRRWVERLSKLDLTLPFVTRGFTDSAEVVPIRFPVVFPSQKMRDVAFEKLKRSGLGASLSYPRTLNQYPELDAHIIKRSCPNADAVSKRILTLPVHRHVTEADIERGADLISQLQTGHDA